MTAVDSWVSRLWPGTGGMLRNIEYTMTDNAEVFLPVFKELLRHVPQANRLSSWSRVNSALWQSKEVSNVIKRDEHKRLLKQDLKKIVDELPTVDECRHALKLYVNKSQGIEPEFIEAFQALYGGRRFFRACVPAGCPIVNTVEHFNKDLKIGVTERYTKNAQALLEQLGSFLRLKSIRSTLEFAHNVLDEERASIHAREMLKDVWMNTVAYVTSGAYDTRYRLRRPMPCIDDRRTRYHIVSRNYVSEYGELNDASNDDIAHYHEAWMRQKNNPETIIRFQNRRISKRISTVVICSTRLPRPKVIIQTYVHAPII